MARTPQRRSLPYIWILPCRARIFGLAKSLPFLGIEIDPIRPILPIFDQAGSDGILADIIPFRLGRFVTPEQAIKNAGLPFPFGVCCLSDPSFNKIGKFAGRSLGVKRRNQGVQMIGHEHGGMDSPVGGCNAGGLEGF